METSAHHHIAGRPYLAEDRELVEEDCGAANQRRWHEIQREQTPEGKREKAEQESAYRQELQQRMKESSQQAAEIKQGKRELRARAEAAVEAALAAEPHKLEALCLELRELGENRAFAAFSKTYEPGPGSPSAIEVFGAITRRCRAGH